MSRFDFGPGPDQHVNIGAPGGAPEITLLRPHPASGKSLMELDGMIQISRPDRWYPCCRLRRFDPAKPPEYIRRADGRWVDESTMLAMIASYTDSHIEMHYVGCGPTGSAVPDYPVVFASLEEAAKDACERLGYYDGAIITRVTESIRDMLPDVPLCAM